MKKWLILTGIFVILFIGGYFALTFYAGKLIQPHLQKALGPGLTLTEMELKATYLSAKGIQYGDPLSKQRFLQVEELRIYPSLLSLLRESVHIKECTMIRPTFFFSRSRGGVLSGPWMSEEKGGKGKEISRKEEEKKKEPIHIRIDRIQIERGTIDFEDMKPERVPANIQLRDLDLRIDDIQFPLISFHSPIQFKGKMDGRTKAGKIDIKGWIDIKTMDMAISLDVQGIDVKTFEPYYRKRVSAEIESGYLNMESKIAVKKRMIDAPGNLELIDLRIKERGGTVLWIPAETFVSLLRDKGNRIKADFHVNGNLDDPRFNLQDTFLTRIAISLAEALGFPIKVIGEDVFKGTEKEAEGLMEGVKSLEELFKKDKEKRR